MSKTVASVIKGFISLATLPISERQKVKTLARISEYIEHEGARTIKTPKGELKFYALRGAGMASAIERFGEDEPETLEWADNFLKSGDVVWDIGANIGMYAMYMALTPNVKVIAFEPSALNYGLLIEHLALNKMDKTVSPLCVALGNKTEIMSLNMSSFEIGHAGNTIGESRNQFRDFETVFSQTVPAITAEDFCKIFNQPAPDHIKLDVDGIEPYIIQGAIALLPKVKTVIIEVEGNNLEHVGELIEKPLFESGFEEDVAYRSKGKCRNRVYVNKKVCK